MRSFELPCSRNTDVVPEKHSSASCNAQRGAQAGSNGPGGGDASATVADDRGGLGWVIQDGGDLIQLVGHAGDLLQLIQRCLGVIHARGGGVDLAAEQIGILAIGRRHLDQRLDLSLDPIQLERRKVGVLHGLPVVLEALLGDRRALLERTDHAVIAALLGVSQARLEIFEAFGELVGVRGTEEAQQRVLLAEESQKSEQQPIERGRPDVSEASTAGGGLRRAGDGTHLEAAHPQVVETLLRLGAQAGDQQGGARRVGAVQPAGTIGVLRIDRLAEARQRHEAAEVHRFARADEREQHVGPGREHGGGAAAEHDQEIPARGEGAPQIVRNAHQSPARVEGCSRSIMSRSSKTTLRNSGSFCIWAAGRSGGGTATSCRIVPGAEEMTYVRSPRYTASSIECVTKNTVAWRSRQRWTNRSCIRIRVVGSSAPNGSSIRMILGRRISVRAIATR